MNKIVKTGNRKFTLPFSIRKWCESYVKLNLKYGNIAFQKKK